MIRQLRSLNAVQGRLPADLCLAFAGAEHMPNQGWPIQGRSIQARRASAGSKAAPVRPSRPDDSILNQTIPLFYIGRNRGGLWVARASDGTSGGLFLLKGSAARFAREQCEPAGCALMFLTEPLELDCGGGTMRTAVAALAAAPTLRPSFLAAIAALAAKLRALFAKALRIRAAGRRNRDLIERELFHGQYKLSSKNDDDLPVPMTGV